jgi:hypothetical protein
VVTGCLGTSDQFRLVHLVTLVREWVHLSDHYYQMNEIQSETHGVHRGGNGGVTGRCACPVRPDQRIRSPRVWLFREPMALFFRGGPINTCWPAPRGLSWTFWLSNILLSWAHPLLLISLAWLPNQSEIEWSQVHLLMSLHLVGTWVFFCYGILISLGGCRHLDDLGQW